ATTSCSARRGTTRCQAGRGPTSATAARAPTTPTPPASRRPGSRNPFRGTPPDPRGSRWSGHPRAGLSPAVADEHEHHAGPAEDDPEQERQAGRLGVVLGLLDRQAALAAPLQRRLLHAADLVDLEHDATGAGVGAQQEGGAPGMLGP